MRLLRRPNLARNELDQSASSLEVKDFDAQSELNQSARSNIRQWANSPRTEDNARSPNECVIEVEDEEQPEDLENLDSLLTDLSEGELEDDDRQGVRGAISTESVLEESFGRPTSPLSVDFEPLQADSGEPIEPELNGSSGPELPGDTQPAAYSPTIACPDCGSQFTDRHFLRRHGKYCRSAGNQWRCSLCPSTFSTASNRAKHLTRVHGKQGVSCSVCLKSFSGKDKLKRHQLLHSGERPFKCESCQATFKSSTVRKEHVMRRHTREKPHQCPGCTYAAVTKSALSKHIKQRQSVLSCDHMFQ